MHGHIKESSLTLGPQDLRLEDDWTGSPDFKKCDERFVPS